jgi:hypothetical protein
MINSIQFNNISRVIGCAELELHLYWDSDPVIVDVISETLNTVSQLHILFFKHPVQPFRASCVSFIICINGMSIYADFLDCLFRLLEPAFEKGNLPS